MLDNINATRNPKKRPENISMKFLPINQAMSDLGFGSSPGTGTVSICSNNSVIQTPKIVIAAISSKLDAAIRVVGIPFFVP